MERYWIGGSGSWNDLNHWSETSGGAGGASVPTMTDNAHFNADSFTATNQRVTIDVIANCANIIFTGVTNSPKLKGNGVLNIYGMPTFSSNMTNEFTGHIYVHNNTSFNGGGLSFYFVHFKNSNVYEIYGANTFNAIRIDAGATIKLEASVKQTIKQISARGTIGNLINIISTIEDTPALIECNQYMFNIYYGYLQDITTTGVASFQALRTTNGGNNSGWSFLDNTNLGQIAPATQQIAGLMQPADKQKIDNIANDADNIESSAMNGNILINGVETTVYTHPISHSGSDIAQDSTHRFVTDAQMSGWDAKTDVTYVNTAVSVKADTSYVDNQLALKLDVATYTASDILTKLLTADGTGSGLDADTIDGIHASALEKISNKGQANGYASLDETGKLPSGQLATHEHSATDITTDETHRFVTDIDKTNWDAKASTNYVDTKVADIVNSAPETLDTLNELALALGDDPNFATTMANQIGLKLDSADYTATDILTKIKTVDGIDSGLDADKLDGLEASAFALSDHNHTGIYEPANTNIQSHIGNTSNPHSVTKIQINLGNVDNTSDLNKPVSTAQQSALNLKENISNKGVVNGYAELDGDGKVPVVQLPDAAFASILTSNDYQVIASVNQTFEVKLI